jgi:hypothetical protein
VERVKPGHARRLSGSAELEPMPENGGLMQAHGAITIVDVIAPFCPPPRRACAMLNSRQLAAGWSCCRSSARDPLKGTDMREIAVTYDLAKGYYIGTAPELHTPVVALSLAVLRKRIEEQLIGEDVDVRLVLDRAARLERDRRRQQQHMAR